jgi:hypothetical protein
MAIAEKVMILKKLSTIQSCAEGNWFQHTLVGKSRERLLAARITITISNS